ncbi:hypothetical protein KRR39_19310 [Nocardioides panacis]|uniref:Uncharacterized protein n=1 Tax=Nocardioides panacis TaxID=2849501 RepID=A0A975SX44_9ACTN|nr:hypothetical protein [Nocardioides panacis]QWZ07555.1 hypothetical protein KRR39_19310 [Nocardioides panacis]
MSETPDPLDRAAALAREEPTAAPDWEQTAGGVMRRIRGTVRPGRSVLVPLTDELGSTTHVNERVVLSALRAALSGVEGAAPSGLRLELDGDVCTAVEVEVVARYDLDLPALGDLCRAVTRSVLRGVLLDSADAVDVRVAVVDVTLEDPRQ